MEDLMELANNEIRSVEKAVALLVAAVKTDSPAATALLPLLSTEFSIAQAQADAWAIYQRAKNKEALVEASVLNQANEAGSLEGRNAEERKRAESYVKDTNPAIVDARDHTISTRNMNDCVSNAHSSLVRAMDLLMEMVKHEDAK